MKPILDDNDNIPGWPIVCQAHEVGIRQAKDFPWRFAGLFVGIAGRVVFNSHNCLPRKPTKVLGQKRGDKLMPHEVLLSRERIVMHEQRVTVYMGQCKRCGFIYWGLPEK